MAATAVAESAGNGASWIQLQQKAGMLLQAGDLAAAANVLEGGIAAARRSGDTSESMAVALNDLGTIYHDIGRMPEAERAYKESIRYLERRPMAGSKLGNTIGNLAGLRMQMGQLSESEKLYIEAERVLLLSAGIEDPDVATVLSGLADVYLETGRLEEARRANSRAVAILSTGGQDSQLGVALFLQAKIAFRMKNEPEAEELLRRTLSLWQATLGRRHLTYISGLTSLAALLSKKNPAEASQLFRESLDLAESVVGPDHAQTGTTLIAYAKHLQATGAKGEAKKWKRRGEEILSGYAWRNRLGQTVDIKAFQNSGIK